MMKSAKIIIFTLFFSLLFGLFTHKTFALNPNSDYLQFEKALASPDMNLESFTANTFSSLQFSIVNRIFGCLTCKDLTSIFKAGAPDGAVQTLATMISAPYVYQPASGIQYVADVGKRINLVDSAYAQQGIGFREMEPVMEIWKTFRNISYSFFAVLFVVLGFAIMFRVKISPQAVVTLQSAIPSIVIALILVTFSYAIVGFLLDITWVINNVILFVFADMFKHLNPVFQPGGGILTEGFIGTGQTATTNAGVLLFRMFNISLLPTFLGLLTFTMSLITITGVASAATMGGAAPVGIALGGIILVIFAIVLLIALLRTLWLLVKTYTSIILSLVFAPFILLAGAIPGNKAISGWFTNLIGNLAVLPTILIMVLLSSYLICATWSQEWGYLVASGFSLGLTSIFSAATGFGPSIEKQMQILILIVSGMSILLMTPKAADIIKGFITGKGFDYGTALGETLGVIVKNPAVQALTIPAQSALKETGAVAVTPVAQGIKRDYVQPVADRFFSSDPGNPPTPSKSTKNAS